MTIQRIKNPYHHNQVRCVSTTDDKISLIVAWQGPILTSACASSIISLTTFYGPGKGFSYHKITTIFLLYILAVRNLGEAAEKFSNYF